MTFTVPQKGSGAAGSTSVTFGSPTTAGSTLVILTVSNIAAGGCTAGGLTLMGGIYGTGHNGDYTGIWYLPNNPGGIRSASVTGCYVTGYLEVTGTAGYPQILAGQSTGGTSTAATSYVMTNPGASASNFTVFVIGYDVSNGGTPYGDGSSGATLLSDYGQFSYTTAAGNATSGTFAARTYDWCAVSFAPASAGGLTPNLLPPAGVYRGPCGGKVRDSNTSTLAQAGILDYENWLGRPVSYVLDYLMEAPTTWAQFIGGQLDQTSGSFSLLSQWGALPSRWTMCLSLSACCGKSIGTGASTWAGEAAGTNDTYWQALGNNLVALGYGNAVIRLGREWNGNWYNWSPALTGDTPAQYIAGYQHIVTLLRNQNPSYTVPGANFTFMWNPALGTVDSYTHGVTEAASYYPGDAYVDSIGLDYYDWGAYPTLATTTAAYPARTAEQQQYNFAQGEQGDDGLNGWAAFAAKRTPPKPLALPEWGPQLWTSYDTTTLKYNYYGGGDDPYYITQMASVASYTYMQAMWEDTGMGLFDTDACTRRKLPANGGDGSGIMPDKSRTLFLALLGDTTLTVTTAFPPASIPPCPATLAVTATIPAATLGGPVAALSVTTAIPAVTIGVGSASALAATIGAAVALPAITVTPGPALLAAGIAILAPAVYAGVHTPPSSPTGPPGAVPLGYPLWTDGMEWTSLLQRQFSGGAAVWDANTSAIAVSPLGGVLAGPAGPLQVTPLATPGMGVLVSAGYCAVPSPAQGDGVYLFGLTGQGALAVAANPTSVARTDIVIGAVYDLGTISSYCDVEIVTGTPGGGQPATPATAILLATVTVAPYATVITAGNITDLRTFTAAPGGVLPATAATAPPLATGQVMINTSTGGLETAAKPVTYTKTFTTSSTWVAPFTGLVWASGIAGGGGGGGGYQDVLGYGSTSAGGAGGGGEWAGDWIPVTEGTSYPVAIGQGGYRGAGGTNSSSPTFGANGADGTATTFTGDGGSVLTCNPGKGGEGAGQAFPAAGGLGGTGSPNVQHQPGGTGGAGAHASNAAGGGGGGSGSPTAPGGSGGNASGATPGTGGTAGPGGGPGGPGGQDDTNGGAGTAPGGGSGGGGATITTYWQAGGNGSTGNLTLTWTVQPAAPTPVLTTPSGGGSIPGEWLSLVSTGTGHGLNTGYGSAYGWGIGAGRGSSAPLNVDGDLFPEIQVPVTADGHTDYAIDVTWGIVVPEAAVDTAAPSIPGGRCVLSVMIDGTILDEVYLNSAASGGVTYPGDAGSFTAYTSSKNGTTPGAGAHTFALAIQTSATDTGSYSGVHIGDLASVGTSPHPFHGGALPPGYTASLIAEQCYLRVTGLSG